MSRKKTCSKCKQVLPLDSFGKDKSKPDGLHAYCKDCRAEQAREKRFNDKYKKEYYHRQELEKTKMPEREFNKFYRKYHNYVLKSISKKLVKQLVTSGHQRAYRHDLGEWNYDVFVDVWMDFYLLPSFGIPPDEIEVKTALLKLIDKVCKRIYRTNFDAYDYSTTPYKENHGAVDVRGMTMDIKTYKTPQRMNPEEKEGGKSEIAAYWRGCSPEMNKGLN